MPTEELMSLIERTRRANADSRELIGYSEHLLERRRSLQSAALAHFRDIASLGRTFVETLLEGE